MVSIALTGNVAAGKSVIADVLEARGIPVVRADELARAVVAPGSPALESLRQAFGEDFIDESGGLDRGAMRSLVIQDASARERLERILHPYIRSARDEWMARQLEGGARVTVSEIPLLYEAGLEDEFDAVVLVHAPQDARETRLVTLRGLARQDARALMAAQGDPEAKIRRADRVIVNDGTLSELEDRAGVLGDDIVEGRFP